LKVRYLRFCVLCILAIKTTTPALAQQALGTWWIFTAQKKIAPQWGAFVEGQSRSWEPLNKWFYYELKGGASYDFNANITGLIGTGIYRTFDTGGNFAEDPLFRDFRIWEQLTFSQYLDRIKFEHRYRLEHIWRNDSFLNRFRYRINVLIPLNKRKVEPKTFFVSASNEFFFLNQKPYFFQNRFYLGSGYQLSKQLSLQVGLLTRYDQTGTTGLRKPFLQVSCQYRLDRAVATKEQMPSTVD
jgi:Protein of unknown function (DUF2490)